MKERGGRQKMDTPQPVYRSERAKEKENERASRWMHPWLTVLHSHTYKNKFQDLLKKGGIRKGVRLLFAVDGVLKKIVRMVVEVACLWSLPLPARPFFLSFLGQGY